MAYKVRKVNEYRERRDFSRVKKSLELADLLEVQTKSYEWFIEDGIKEVLEEISPVENFSGTLSLEFGEYSFDEPRHTIKECKEKKTTYAAPLKVQTRLFNNETGEVKDVPVKTGERVISKKHADEMLNMMESVVALGTGKRAQVKGYRVGGKTGTSEDGVNTNKYIASFLGVAPISDPTVIVLVTLYDPKGEGGHQGGVVAAPVGGQVLSEVLPYLELNKDDEKEEDIRKQVEVPNVEGLTIKEATKILKDLNLNIQIENEPENLDKENTIVREQVPKKGIKVYEGTKVIIKI